MKMWRKQDSFYLGATVAAFAVAVAATFAASPGEIEPFHMAGIGHDLTAPLVASAPTEHVRRVVRRVVVRVLSPPRVIVETPTPTKAPVATKTLTPKKTPAPTKEPVVPKPAAHVKKPKKTPKNERGGASGQR